MKYVISDIHGEYELFLKLLDKIYFSKNDKMIINKMVIGLGIAQTSLINHIPFYLASIVLGCIFLFYNLLLF